MQGHTIQNDYVSPLPFEYIKESDLPKSFTWGDINGVSYLTKALNQHLPQVRMTKNNNVNLFIIFFSI